MYNDNFGIVSIDKKPIRFQKPYRFSPNSAMVSVRFFLRKTTQPPQKDT